MAQHDLIKKLLKERNLKASWVNENYKQPLTTKEANACITELLKMPPENTYNGDTEGDPNPHAD